MDGGSSDESYEYNRFDPIVYVEQRNYEDLEQGHEDFPVDDISRNPEIFEIIDLHAQEENPVLDSIEISQSPRDSIDVVDPWDKVRNSLRLFNLIRFQEIKEKGSPSSTKARQALKNITEIEKDQIPDKIIGDVPGVNVGMSFMFREELVLSGVHCRLSKFVDVDSGGVVTSIIIPLGECNFRGKDSIEIHVRPLKNAGFEGIKDLFTNMKTKTPVRVVIYMEAPARSIGQYNKYIYPSHLYFYDGLYVVEEWSATQEVYHALLSRLPDQDSSEKRDFFKSQLHYAQKEVPNSFIVSRDLAGGREIIPIRCVNAVDYPERPPEFEYLRRMSFSSQLDVGKAWNIGDFDGCSHLHSCDDLNQSCPCVQLNGGRSPYVSSLFFSSENKIIFECGPLCKCFCSIKVIQKGPQFRFEVFRTKTKRWGLRSLDIIPLGAFVCACLGVMKEADEISDGFESNLIVPYDGFYDFLELQGGSEFRNSGVEKEKRMVVDLREKSNISRFIGHSPDPNLVVRFVVVLAESTFPIICFFAGEHIGPMQELTFNHTWLSPSLEDK